MYNNELKRIIDQEEIVVSENDCYLALAKVGEEVSVNLEGKDEVLIDSLLSLMKKYPVLKEIVLEAADVYED